MKKIIITFVILILFLFSVAAVANAADLVYVTDSDAKLVNQFSTTGTFNFNWGGFGVFQDPFGVAVDSSSGDVYVADTGNRRIQKFDSAGNFERMWGWGVDNASTNSFQICTSGCTGGISGSGDGQFNTVLGIAVDQSSGDVYTVDDNNNRIQKFDSNGNFILKWGKNGGDGTLGTGDGEFFSPTGVAVDSSGNVYVVDQTNKRIQKFDSNGIFILKWSSSFDQAFDIAVDQSSGDVYVLELSSSNPRVQKFTSTGTFILQWGGFFAPFDRPTGIAVDSSGDVYVTDSGLEEVFKFDSAGNAILSWTGPGFVRLARVGIFSPPVCGNGVVEADEQCDDGNNVNGDGCDANCQIEPVAPVCGNGVVEAGEQCEPPNQVNICDANCINIICGNLVVQGNEECDDGNTNSNDGCNFQCELEVCGDFVVQPGIGEQCDPPNQPNCDANCQQISICGDGVTEGAEDCDPGSPPGVPSTTECVPFGQFCQLAVASTIADGSACTCVNTVIPEFSIVGIIAAIAVIGMGTMYIFGRKKQ